jgi:predicted Ser/Thr protein kinase
MTSASFAPLQALLEGRYTLERELGRGGMGVVYLARDARLDRLVAIKVLPRAMAGDPELRERFLREARTSAQLSHPNIVPIYGADEIDGVGFFAMGFVDGENLADRIRTRGPLPPAEAVRVLREAAWALAYAHARGVVHRDVKPENIMIERGSGRAVVTDFGIAQNQRATPLTQGGMVLGSVHYMSPEQAAGDTLDGRSDLYSLGVVGFQILSGRLPFEGEGPASDMAQQVTRPAPSLGDVAPDLPIGLVAVIDQCLSKEPAARYATGEAFAEALETALQSASLPVVAGSQAEVVSTDQARAIWSRAAQLQAEATTRLQARYREPLQEGATEGGVSSGGYRLQDVELAAEEAGIAAEFVAMAIAERPAGHPARSTDFSEREERVLTRMLGTRDRSISCSRVIQAPPATVLETIGRVFPSPPYGLKLRDTVGGHPLDGGIMVFKALMLRGAIVAFDNVRSIFSYRMTQLELEQLHVALKPLGTPVAVCEVTVSGDLRRGLRKAWTIDKWFSGVVGSVGAAAGAGLGLTIALGPLAAAVGLGCAAVAGGLSLAGCRWGYRHALRHGRTELEGLLAALDGELHAASVFGTSSSASGARRLAGGSGNPRALPGASTAPRYD